MNLGFFSILIALSTEGCQGPAVPLRTVSEIPLPGSSSRFDYQSLDPKSGRLYISHMGAGTLVVFDTNTNKVIAELPGYPTVTGVLAVPEEGKVYAAAAGGHEVIVTDMKTLHPIAKIVGARFPDGIAYASRERKIFVSDESGGIDLVIDARTDRTLGKIDLGGEAGNTHYDAGSDTIWVAVQTRNEMVGIDPKSQKITARFKVEGEEGPHGFLIDPDGVHAYVSSEDNNKLVVVDLQARKTRADLGSFTVTGGPDVLALDEGLKRLYLACEEGAIEVFAVTRNGLTHLGTVRRPNAHSVAVNQKTHCVYVPLKDVGGRPMMWVLEPT